ncbi:MAG: hypothetical protein ACTSWW_11310 [Promethearchaeota archaeon]
MKASFGKIIITPPGGPEGVPMAGYSRAFPASGKLDDLYARAVLIESNGDIPNRILLISLDLLKIPLSVAEYIKKKIKQNADGILGEEQILIHAIHTHSGPDISGEFYWPGSALNVLKGIMFGENRNDSYIVWFTLQIVNMVKELIRDLQGATFARKTKQITKDIVINRRHPARRSKKNLTVFVFKRTKDNEIFGILANYGMHPTTLSYMNDKISAEYPGRVCHRIEASTKGKIQAAYFTAPSGDLNPITTCGTDFDRLETDPDAHQTVYDQLGTYHHTKELGYYLGDQALELAQSILAPDFYDEVRFQTIIKKIQIPIHDYQPYIYDLKIWLSNKLKLYIKKWFLYPVAMRHSKQNAPNFPAFSVTAHPFSFRRGKRLDIHTDIQYLNITASNSTNPAHTTEFSLLGIPGELFEDLETQLKAKSPNGPDHTTLIQNTNWVGYLFSIKDYITEGGYEPLASSTPVGGKHICREFFNLFEEIQAGGDAK